MQQVSETGTVGAGNGTGSSISSYEVSSDISVRSGYIEQAVAAGTMANGNFRLSQLANFYDSEGRFLIDTPQKIDREHPESSGRLFRWQNC